MDDSSVCLVETLGWGGFESPANPGTGCGISVLATDAPKPQILNSEERLKADSVQLDKYKHALDP